MNLAGQFTMQLKTSDSPHQQKTRGSWRSQLRPPDTGAGKGKLRDRLHHHDFIVREIKQNVNRNEGCYVYVASGL